MTDAKEFDKDKFIEQGGLFVDDDCIWNDGVKHVPERTCRIEVHKTWLYCSRCHTCVNGGFSDATSHYPMRYCPSCGAKVTSE